MDDRDEKVGTIYEGTRIGQAESALFERFIHMLNDGRYDECHKITGLMERLSLI